MKPVILVHNVGDVVYSRFNQYIIYCVVHSDQTLG